ncbi:alpha-amylase, partial [Salmonella enterica subsp. enterica serovar Montevideo]|nr:alpha-amylase [Salmonella enterica subsp. enterica serovar Montevideo]
SGTEENPGCVVVLSNGDDGEKTLLLGDNYANKTWRDFLGNRSQITGNRVDAKRRHGK